MRSVTGYHSRAQIKAIFESVNHVSDQEGLVSKYLEYELHRMRQVAVDAADRFTERHRVLHWYTNSYALMRRGELLSVPLSVSQACFLNGPMPLAGSSDAITVALYNAWIEAYPNQANLRDLENLYAAVYWWCCEHAPKLNLDDRLITSEQLDLLQSECEWQGEPFALTVFSREYFRKNPELHYLDLANQIERSALFYYLLLKSFSNPILARCLKPDLMRKALIPLNGRDGASAFEHLIQSVGRVDAVQARDVIEQGKRVLAEYGFSFAKGWVQKDIRDGNTGDCFRQLRTLDEPIEDGVAIIGPIYSTSGLGQATRRSLQVMLQAENHVPTVIPFKIDNPSPISFAAQVEISRYKNRRAINLLHLNAESIPLAFAYMQSEIFEKSYNVGYFFWELNTLPKCHNLALEMLDEIWVSSEYNREIYAKHTDVPVINVGMAVEDLPTIEPVCRASLDIEKDSFVFFASFDSFSFIQRKNPLGVIRAFLKAFTDRSENVRLVIKTQNRARVHDQYQRRVWAKIDQIVIADRRVLIIDETYEYYDLLALELTCDCYISLHRSEGWGFGMIEAMQLSRPVICTAYSGNMEFCSEETAYLVDYELVNTREEEYIFVERGSVWADPNTDTAARLMREVFCNQAAAAAKGARAMNYVKKNFSVEAISKRYRHRLSDIRSVIL